MKSLDDYIAKLKCLDDAEILRKNTMYDLRDLVKEMSPEDISIIQRFWDEILASGKKITEIKMVDQFNKLIQKN